MSTLTNEGHEKMRFRHLAIGLCFGLCLSVTSHAEVRVMSERNVNEEASSNFTFRNVPPPARDDAASSAEFSIVDGRRDPNGGDAAKLNDGHVPTKADEPRESFFFGAGTSGGRLLVDLGKTTDIRQVNTYSWHPQERGPQVYKLFASDGTLGTFNPQPTTGTDPATCGWTLVTTVDTRPQAGPGGGQYGVSISDPAGSLGEYRYFLFDIARTDASGPFNNTFYSEIDIVDPKTLSIATTVVPRTGQKIFEIEESGCRITVDTSETPDLTEWVHNELMPVVLQWYPKIVAMLPSEGFVAPQRLTIVFSRDMQGVAATGGTRVSCAANWFRRNLQGEAKGAVVHELVHVVQQYGRVRGPGGTRPPGWLVEGIADYVRWFLYESETHGADISRRAATRVSYDDSYRVSANFLNWVVEQHGPEIVRHVNAAAREGRYREELWKEHTGRTLPDLRAAWQESLQQSANDNPASDR